MASMFDVFRSAQSNAQRVSVEDRETIISTNKSIITTGRGLTPANIFTLGDDDSGVVQEDLKQTAPSTLNRIPRIVGECVTGGIVVYKDRVGTAPNGNAITSYVLVLSHTNIAQDWSTVNTSDETELTNLLDTRFFTDPGGVIVSSVMPGFCLTTPELTPTQDHDCWYGSYQPAIYYNGQICIFGSNGVVEGLADPTKDYSDPANVTTINDNFRVAVYVGSTDSSNQVFPANGQNASSFASIPNSTKYFGLVFACIEVTSDPEIDITGLGEWKFGIDNISNYLPAGNLYTRERKNNPSIILQEYLTNTRYGVGLANTYIDATSFGEWESNCHLDVFSGTAYGTNPGEWVYQDPRNSSGTLTSAPWMATNNAINTSLSVGENIKRITQTGLGQLHWDHELQKFRVIKQRGQRFSDINSLFNFNSDNIIGKIDISSGDFFNLPTFAEVRYPDVRLLSQSNNIRMNVSAGDLQANEPLNGVSYEFPMINGRARAQVMANISLYENREDTIITFDADYTTRDTQVGDYVTITDAAQGLDTQVARIIRITEEVLPEGGLIYRYQLKKYNDKPFQPQSYSDDPYEATDDNLFVQEPIYIRVVEAVVCDAAGSTPNPLDTPITVYTYNYATNANTDVTPSSITSTSTTGFNMNINYGYPSFDNNFIAFAVEGTGAAMDKLKVVAKTGDDYWMPTYDGQTYTFDSPLDGDPNYTGNTRYILLRTDKLGQNATASQPDNYVFDINYYYSQSYPNLTTNTFRIDHPMATEWNITGNAQVSTTYGDTYISQDVANVTATTTTQTTSTLQHDIGALASDNYYLHVSGTVNPGTQSNVYYQITKNSWVEVRAVCDIEHTQDKVHFTSGNTDAQDAKFAKSGRRTMVLARIPATDLAPGTDYNFTSKVALDFWPDLGVFPTGKTQVFLQYRSYIIWQWTHPDIIQPGLVGSATISNLKYEIRNNSRMKDEP